MNFETIQFDVQNGEAVVTLNRPDVRNAFNPEMIHELTAVFANVAKRDDIAVVLLKGAGKGFCAGADLAYMKSMASFTLAENEHDAEKLFDMFSTIRSLPQVLIAHLHGAVMGGGLGLASLADIAAANDDTKFCFSEVKLGLAPATISPFVLERMNASAARRFMLTAAVFDSGEALQSGLIQFAGSADAVAEYIAKQSRAIRTNGAEAVRETKAVLRDVTGGPDQPTYWSAVRALTIKSISERRVSAEGQEGLKSFLEKREPSWRKDVK